MELRHGQASYHPTYFFSSKTYIPQMYTAGRAHHDPVYPKIPHRSGIVIHVAELFELILFLSLLAFALFLKWVQPSLMGLVFGSLLGTGSGLAGGYLFYFNRGYKDLLSDGVRLYGKIAVRHIAWVIPHCGSESAPVSWQLNADSVAELMIITHSGGTLHLAEKFKKQRRTCLETDVQQSVPLSFLQQECDLVC